jgi:ribosomal protein S13
MRDEEVIDRLTRYKGVGRQKAMDILRAMKEEGLVMIKAEYSDVELIDDRIRRIRSLVDVMQSVVNGDSIREIKSNEKSCFF